MNELQHYETPQSDLTDRMSYAKAVSAAPILPDAFKQQPANILVAMEVADALGKRPFMVMQELAIISGKPSFSAKFMRGLVREAGHRLRESYSGGTARAEVVRHDDPEFTHVAEWDEDKARQHEYWGKGHWKKNPELMLKNRALSEVVREACPEVLGGVAYTPDEVQDFAPQQQPKAQVTSISDAVAERKDSPRSNEQSKRLFALMEQNGLSDKDESLAFFASVIGRDIESTKELTATECDQLIASLETDSADPETGEIQDAEVVE